MNKYRILNIAVKDFKLFGGDEFIVNFNSNDLIVLDGPNGYGKTSIFDAIELALTGTIRRLISVEGRQTPNDVVVAYNNSKNTEVRLTVIEEVSKIKITIIRRLKKKLPVQSTKINNFHNLWDIFELKNGIEKTINQSILNKLIGCDSLIRDYTLFHYVEQEDTAHFLKSNSEVERAKALSHLLGDTSKVEEQYNKILSVKKIIDQNIQVFIKRKLQLESQYSLPSLVDKAITNKIEYKKLLPWEKKSIEWDLVNIDNFSLEKKNEFMQNLIQIRDLLTHKKLFLALTKYQYVTSQTEVLESFIKHYHHFDSFDFLKRKKAECDILTLSIKSVNMDSLEKLSANINLKKLFEVVSYPNPSDFILCLNNLIDFRKRNKTGNILHNELVNYRRSLNDVAYKVDCDSKDCILCGSKFQDRNTLIKSIEQKGDALKLLLSDDDKKLLELNSDFNDRHIKKLHSMMEELLTANDYPSEEYLISLEKGLKIRGRITGLINWLSSESIYYEDLISQDKVKTIPNHVLLERFTTLKNRINEKSPDITEDYINSNVNGSFELLYGLHFENKSVNLKSVNESDVDEKISYVMNIYLLSLSTYQDEYKIINYNIENLENKLTKVKDICTTIKTAISTYRKTLIKDIEIPFYIYSGKVLQTHQSGIGNGIFIKDKNGGQELKNIRLVSDWDSDHDILNVMSSGQIAAVIITLVLTLNKVYQKGLHTILIDDPVQTMDEINMISLVELLRNDFSDRQVILSTHEHHVSRYFLYKYLKYGKSARQVNLMERKEYQLSSLQRDK